MTLHLYRTCSRLFLRSEFDRLVAASMFFGFTMSILRVIHTGSTAFFYMTWNLFLGYIPYLLSTWLSARAAAVSLATPAGATANKPHRSPLTLSVAFIWLLFIPNSFYMLTDLFHLSDNYRDTRVPQWYDLILILTFALNGLLLGVLSVRHMEKLFVTRTRGAGGWGELSPGTKSALFLVPIMFLNALGVYIGRYMRYNSWNIITHPFRLIIDIARIMIHPLQNAHAWGMVVCFTILLTLLYNLMKKFSQALI